MPRPLLRPSAISTHVTAVKVKYPVVTDCNYAVRMTHETAQRNAADKQLDHNWTKIFCNKFDQNFRNGWASTHQTPTQVPRT